METTVQPTRPISRPVAGTTMRDQLLDFCQQAFEHEDSGDLIAAARAAAVRAVRNGLVSGPLWAELGPEFVAQLMRTRRFHVLRRWSTGHNPPDDHPIGAEATDEGHLKAPYYLSGRWFVLGDFTRAMLLTLAEDRMTRARALTIDARFHERLAKGLTSATERVADRYTETDLLRIHEEVEREEQ